MSRRYLVITPVQSPLDRVGYGFGFLFGRAVAATFSSFLLSASSAAVGGLLAIEAVGAALAALGIAVASLLYVVAIRRNWLALLGVVLLVAAALPMWTAGSRVALFALAWGYLAATSWALDLYRKHNPPRVASPTATPRDPSLRGAPGATCLVEWPGDGHLYLAAVSERRGHSLLAHFAPGCSVWIDRSRLAPDDLRSGDRVWAHSARRGWIAAKVVERKGHSVRLREASGEERVTSAFGLSVVRSPALSATTLS